MSDRTVRITPDDPNRVNVNHPWEVMYFSSLLSISEDELRKAVEAVGPELKDLRAHLGK